MSGHKPWSEIPRKPGSTPITPEVKREFMKQALAAELDIVLARRFPDNPSGTVTELISDDVLLELAEAALAYVEKINQKQFGVIQ